MRLSFAAVVLLFLTSLHAWGAETGPAARACEILPTVDFSAVQDASIQITEAAPISPGKDVPAVCDVQGYVSSNIGFHFRLPLSNWNGKFIEVGCGGSCGVFFDFLCNTPLSRGYACIASDMGHKSTTTDGKWAYNNLQAEVDWSFRATHIVALAGKAITERYYGRKPNFSYFHGCSTGGRQGTIEAQRFPWDFDGIIAGAPPFSETDALMHVLWNEQAVRDSKGQPMFTEGDLKQVHEAVLRQCDMDDGVKDGIVSNPHACHFNPETLLCAGGLGSACLAADKVEALKRLYAGPTTSSGQKISSGGVVVGAELNFWASHEAGENSLGEDSIHYMSFMPDPSPGWKASDFDWDRDFKRFGMMESLYGNTNPDLRKFKAAGGKLLLYHGWADWGASPLNSVDYYETVSRTMGGLKPTQEFFRLFLVPGMNHCSGGDGAFAIDYLTYLENWVEKGEAPEVMIGAHLPSFKQGYAAFTGLEFPLDPAIPLGFTRPVYPYPLRATYRGSGDPSRAKNFVPIGPQK